MKHEINENFKIRYKDTKGKEGLYIDDIFVTGFKTIDQCKNEKLNIYAYIDTTEPGELNVKVGWAKNGVYNRYQHQDRNLPWQRVIGLWHVDSETVADYYVHSVLQEKSKIYKKDKYYHWNEEAANREDGKGSTELYLIESIEGIHKLLKDIDNCTGSKNVLKTNKLYKDIQNLVKEIKKDDELNNILYLCTRWGKTNTILELSKLHNMVDDVRITIMGAYVGTVRHSYQHSCNTTTNYNNILFIDPDKYDTEKELYDTMVAHLTADQKNHIMFYVALTGDERTFNRRISVLEHFENVKKQLIIEEADYGSHCENQLKKIHKIWEMGISYNYITTGTGWDKVKKISDELLNVKLYKREYLKDVLGSK